MKRVADKQLIRDDPDREDDDGNEPGKGFALADENVLATRKIRGLPKRIAGGSFGAGGLGPAPTSVASTSVDPPPKFAGFAGFGAPAPAPASTSFAFNSSATTTAPLPSGSLFSSSPFGSTPSAPSAPSNAAKTFANFLSGPTNGTTEGKPSSTESPAPKPAQVDQDKHAVDYYTSLRGLNVSVVNAIKKYVDEDPFFDISELLEQYKKLRAYIQQDFDSSKKSTAPPPQAKPAAEPPTFTMPVPPKAFSGFGGAAVSSKPATTTSMAPTLGFSMPTPPATFGSFGSSSKPAAPPSEAKDSSSSTGPVTPSFGFGSKPPTSPLPSLSVPTMPFTSAPSAVSTPSSTSLFGSTNKDSNPFASPTTSSAPSSLPFSFSKPSGPSENKDAPISSLPFSFSASSKEPPKSVFGSLAKEENRAETPATTPSLFGSSSRTSSSFGGLGGSFGAPSSGSTPFTFGSSSTPLVAATSSEPAAKPAFSFGSSAASTSGSASGFSFGGGSAFPSAAAAKKLEEDENKEGRVAASEGAASSGDTDGAASVLGVNPHDEEGQGEEDEVTTYSTKSKAYRMKKADEKGGPGWVEIGYGILRLKKHKESEARRVLLRNSTTGKINMNFKLYAGLKPSQAKKSVTFVGHDNGVAQTYNVRVGSEQQATELKQALEREVALVKAAE